MQWDAPEILEHISVQATGRHEGVEKWLIDNFLPLPAQHITKPTIITDRCGRILLCYLPDIITEDTYVCSPIR